MLEIALWFILCLLVEPNRLVICNAGASKCIPLSSGCGCRLDDDSGQVDLSPMMKLSSVPPMYVFYLLVMVVVFHTLTFHTL